MNKMATYQPASPPRSTPDESRTVRKVAWRIMPLIMVCYLFAFFDRINISFAKFALQSDLRPERHRLRLWRRPVRRRLCAFRSPQQPDALQGRRAALDRRIMVSWGIATALMAFVQAEWQFYMLRFLIGAMEAGFAPGVLFYLTLWFPVAYRGRITSTLVPGFGFRRSPRCAGRGPRPVTPGRRPRDAGLALAVPGWWSAVRRARLPRFQGAEGPHSGRRLADTG